MDSFELSELIAAIDRLTKAVETAAVMARDNATHLADVIRQVGEDLKPESVLDKPLGYGRD